MSEPNQLELLAREVTPESIDHLKHCLSAGAWLTRAQLVDLTGWSERKVRMVAAAAGAHVIVRGPQGFCLADKVDPTALMQCANIFLDQARKMQAEALAWQALAHAKLGSVGTKAL